MNWIGIITVLACVHYLQGVSAGMFLVISLLNYKFMDFYNYWKINLVQHSNLFVAQLGGWVQTSVVKISWTGIVGTTCGTKELYSEAALSLNECQSMAETIGCQFIFFQSKDDWCQMYKSCDTTSSPSKTGTNYEYTGKAYNIIISKCFQLCNIIIITINDEKYM